MVTVNISLPDAMKAFVEERAAKEGYGSVSEYLRAIIRDVQRRQARLELGAKLLEGLQGPASEMTREDWESIEREATDGLAGEAIRP